MSSAREDEIRALTGKARRSLNAAEVHVREGDYDFASSRAYYAVFYAMEAALITKDLSCSTHAGLIRAFSEHFILSGDLPRAFGKQISLLFRDRQVGDYEAGMSIDEEGALHNLAAAKEIIAAIDAYLTKGGWTT